MMREQQTQQAQRQSDSDSWMSAYASKGYFPASLTHAHASASAAACAADAARAPVVTAKKHVEGSSARTLCQGGSASPAAGVPAPAPALAPVPVPVPVPAPARGRASACVADEVVDPTGLSKATARDVSHAFDFTNGAVLTVFRNGTAVADRRRVASVLLGPPVMAFQRCSAVVGCSKDGSVVLTTSLWRDIEMGPFGTASAVGASASTSSPSRARPRSSASTAVRLCRRTSAAAAERPSSASARCMPPRRSRCASRPRSSRRFSDRSRPPTRGPSCATFPGPTCALSASTRTTRAPAARARARASAEEKPFATRWLSTRLRTLCVLLLPRGSNSKHDAQGQSRGTVLRLAARGRTLLEQRGQSHKWENGNSRSNSSSSAKSTITDAGSTQNKNGGYRG